MPLLRPFPPRLPLRRASLAASAVLSATQPAPAAALTLLSPAAVAASEKESRNGRFDPVGRVSTLTDAGGFSASGVYLGDGYVLTAAHVVDRASSLRFELDGRSYDAAAWAWHEDWDPERVDAGADIAVVQLGGSVSRDAASARLYTGRDEAGRAAYTAGYGRSGTGDSGAVAGTPLRKRAGTNRIDAIHSGDTLLSDFDSGRGEDNRFGSSGPLGLEMSLAPGDSGGGLFLWDAAASAWAVAGVNSFIASFDEDPDSGFGGVSGQVRVSSYLDWIDGLTGGAAGGNLADLAGTTGQTVFSEWNVAAVPEPASICAVGSLLLLARRRRSAAG